MELLRWSLPSRMTRGTIRKGPNCSGREDITPDIDPAVLAGDPLPIKVCEPRGSAVDHEAYILGSSPVPHGLNECRGATQIFKLRDEPHC